MQHLTFIIKGINQNIWNLWTKPWTQTQTGNTLYPFRSKSFGHAQFWGTKWFAKNWSAFISRDIWKYEGGMTKVSINFQIHYLISGKVWHFFRNVENKFLVRVFILLLCYTKVIKSGNNTTPHHFIKDLQTVIALFGEVHGRMQLCQWTTSDTRSRWWM